MRSRTIIQAFGLTLYFTAAWSLGPTRKYCTLQLDPTGLYNCPAGQTCKPIIGDLTGDFILTYGTYGRCEDLDPTGKYCNSDADCPSGRCGMPEWKPWRPWTRNNIGQRKRSRSPRDFGCIRNCYHKSHCKKGEKCASSRKPSASYGICVPKKDPRGKFCRSWRECKWRGILETCSKVGECVSRFQ